MGIQFVVACVIYYRDIKSWNLMSVQCLIYFIPSPYKQVYTYSKVHTCIYFVQLTLKIVVNSMTESEMF
jgi:hypothetical protein